jgi:beta-glucosidase
MSEQTITGDETLRGVFAPDFLNGAATASYQIEGAYNVDGKALSNWDHFMADKLENGNDAVMSYKYWREDVALLKRYGMNAYRFSISWSRVKPLGGCFMSSSG